MSFPLVVLGEVLTHYREYIDAPEPREYPKLSVKLYGRGVVLDEPADGSLLKMKRHQIAKAGQVILSEIWGKKGAIGLVPPGGEGALCTSHFFLFDIRCDRLEPGYLELIFKGNYLEPQLGSEAQGTTGYAAVRPRNLLAATIPLPPLAEQRRIVARVEAVAARVSKARRLREEASTEVDALLPSTRRHVFSTLRGDPVLPLEDVCESIIDTLHSDPIYSDDGIPCVRSPDVREGWLDLHQALRTSEEEFHRRTVRAVPRTGDVIYVRQGGGTGRAAVVQEGQRFSLGQAMMLLRPDTDRVLPRFLYHQLRSPQVLEDQLAPCYIGTASPRVNIGTLRQFRLEIPPLPDQRGIVAHLDALQAKADALRALQAETAAELDALLPAVLAKAFAGEL